MHDSTRISVHVEPLISLLPRGLMLLCTAEYAHSVIFIAPHSGCTSNAGTASMHTELSTASDRQSRRFCITLKRRHIQL